MAVIVNRICRIQGSQNERKQGARYGSFLFSLLHRTCSNVNHVRSTGTTFPKVVQDEKFLELHCWPSYQPHGDNGKY